MRRKLGLITAPIAGRFLISERWTGRSGLMKRVHAWQCKTTSRLLFVCECERYTPSFSHLIMPLKNLAPDSHQPLFTLLCTEISMFVGFHTRKNTALPDLLFPYLFIQMFLVALSFAYFAKALSGSYMKSTITQLERRFDIPSYLIGVIDGSFEIGESSRP